MISDLQKDNVRLKEEAATQVNVDVLGKILDDEICGVANYFSIRPRTCIIVIHASIDRLHV